MGFASINSRRLDDSIINLYFIVELRSVAFSKADSVYCRRLSAGFLIVALLGDARFVVCEIER